jgi:tRNA(Ile)-lysidine synthase
VPVGSDDLPRRVRDAFLPRPPLKLGVAVSGGGDSVALLHVLAGWARDGGPELSAVTVDHGLRAEAAAEAAGVAAMCNALGVPHDTLRWQGWDGTGNLMDAARRARIGLIADWAQERGIGAVALGHTMDDQAETFLMRLARGSGVDGLVGMSRMRFASGVQWERPLLAIGRDELRQYLLQKRVAWVDDPTNDDTAFDRIKMRQALALLAPLGITKERLAGTAGRMATAKFALQMSAYDFVKAAAREIAGGFEIDLPAFRRIPDETQLRLLAAAVRWVSASDYRPRLDASYEALANVMLHRKRTLSGCILQSDATHIRITREPRAVATLTGPTDQPWDKRWHLTGPHAPDLEIRALGTDGLRQAKDWRATGIPRDTLIVTPGVWRGQTLVAAPCAGFGASWTATVSPSFVAFLLAQ